jgi:Fe(3+) dicitrate transport protein
MFLLMPELFLTVFYFTSLIGTKGIGDTLAFPKAMDTYHASKATKPGYSTANRFYGTWIANKPYSNSISNTVERVSIDTVPFRSLDSVYIISVQRNGTVKPLPDVADTYIYSGKKTELIDVAHREADVTNKVARQLFVKVPGIFVYDMDGAGNQLNISARGLDPHRGWEFNLRKDGVITNSDMYGYPASHYSMPMESIERIQIVRGTGSLQYGAQFGGMINYVSKQADTSRRISFENISSVGSYNQLSTYNAIGGRAGKFTYYAYYYKKSRDGYRDNEHTDSEAQQVTLSYQATSNFSVTLEWARSEYVYRIPGPLTDQQYVVNPRQATRSRNYFNPDINLPSIRADWTLSPHTKLQFVSAAVLGKRNSVMYDKPTNVRDTINPATLNYNNRQIDIDRFRSYTTELRLLHEYEFARFANVLVSGVQYMNNNLNRSQLGKGTTGSDFDLTLLDPQWGRDLYLRTTNIAFFTENNIRLTDKLRVGIGVRVESGKTDLTGKISYYPEEQIPVTMDHRFPLIGANFSYKASKFIEIYGGYSQAYRAMAFKDLIPSSTFEKIDSSIKDAKGYNLEAGLRGSWSFLSYDVTGYILQYNNRFGTLALTDGAGGLYTYRTNTGNSLSKGLEILLQANWQAGPKTLISVFTSTSLMDARYTKGEVKNGNANINIKGNRVESAPSVISRSGLSARAGKLSVSAIYSYTARTYADALNTIVPPAATGATGLVPSYGLLDLNAIVRISSTFECRFNLNNATNKQYFTKRPMFYPGPGVWPSEGRNANVSIAIRI